MMGRQSGLGRGLGALIPPKPEEAPAPSVRMDSVAGPPRNESGVLEIRVDLIDPNPQQPRSVFNANTLDELASSIRLHGVLQPIVVSQTADGRYELITGERRWRASRLAGRDAVPAIIRSITEQQKLECSIIENIQRDNLNPLEEAEAFIRLQHEFGLTQEDVADRVGKSRPQVANTIRLLHLPQIMQDSLVEGNITMSHARALLAIDEEPEQQKMFQRMLEGMTSRQVEEHAASIKQTKVKTASVPMPNPNFEEWVTRLRNAIAAKVIIKRSAAGKGEIRIPFQSDEDLHALMHRLAPAAPSEEME